MTDLLLLFQFLLLFIYLFSSLIATARTSKTMFDEIGKNGHPCLVPNLKGNIFSFSLLNMMLAEGLSGKDFILSYVLSKPNLWRALFFFFLNHTCIINFTKECFKMIMFFILQLVNRAYHIDWLVDIEKSLHSWDKFHLIMVYDHFNVLLESVSILLRIFAYYTGLWFSFLCIISLSGFGIKMMVVS